MRRFQFTLLGLFGLLTGAALGCAALMHPTALWCSAVAIAVVTALFAAVLGAVYRRGADRAFWLGFAVFGWGYVILIYGPIVIYSPDEQLNRPYASPNNNLPFITPEPSAISNGPIVHLYRLLHGNLPPGPALGGTGMGFMSVVGEDPAGANEENPFVDPDATIPGIPPTGPPSFGNFAIIGNMLAAAAFALLGGILARWFHATRERAPAASQPQARSPLQA